MTTSPDRSRGFTLVEILVALMLTGMVAVGVHDVFGAMVDNAARVTAVGRALDSAANRNRFLRALAMNVETGGPTNAVFGGDSTHVAFATWCAVANGWHERCRASLTVERQPGGASLVARLSTGEIESAFDGPPDIQLRFLVRADAGGWWVSRWSTGPETPRAIGIMSARDTIILRIGDRG